MANKPYTGIFKNCLICHNKFYVKKYRLEIAKYCSLACKGKSETLKITSNCKICGNEFNHISSRCNKAKYCSRVCYYKGQRLNGTIKFNCVHCGKEFNGSPSHIGKRKYCSKRCVGKSNHKIFKPKFTTVRKIMLIRGLIKSCNRCGYDLEPLILGVHHKDRNRNNNEMSNLEILCPNCHSLEHMKHIAH